MKTENQHHLTASQQAWARVAVLSAKAASSAAGYLLQDLTEIETPTIEQALARSTVEHLAAVAKYLAESLAFFSAEGRLK